MSATVAQPTTLYAFGVREGIEGQVTLSDFASRWVDAHPTATVTHPHPSPRRSDVDPRRCQHCGTVVTKAYARVFADGDGIVRSCGACPPTEVSRTDRYGTTETLSSDADLSTIGHGDESGSLRSLAYEPPPELPDAEHVHAGWDGDEPTCPLCDERQDSRGEFFRHICEAHVDEVNRRLERLRELRDSDGP